jgi:hypothetical protein
MKKFSFYILLCMVTLLSACSDSNIPDEAAFAAFIDAPVTAKVDVEMSMEASLKNVSSENYTLSRAGGFFYFIIKDEEGKVNDFAMTMPLVKVSLKSQNHISESYKYTFKKPGVYEISAVARFSIGNGDNEKKYEENSNIIKVEVK